MKIRSLELITGLYEEYDYPSDWRIIKNGKYYDNSNQRLVTTSKYILMYWCYYNVAFKKYLL